MKKIKSDIINPNNAKKFLIFCLFICSFLIIKKKEINTINSKKEEEYSLYFAKSK